MKRIATSSWKKSLFVIAIFSLLLPPFIGRLFTENKVEAAFQFLPSPFIDETAVGLLSGGTTFTTFNVGAPGVTSAPVTITGLQTGETVIGIDFRPKGSDLVGLTNQNRIYNINPANGAATQIGTAPFTGATGALATDFNPVPDRLRVVGGAQNLRLNPDNGAIANAPPADLPLTFAAGDPNAGDTPNVVAAAYTNNFLGSISTTLYVLEFGNNILATQGTKAGVTPAVSPNLGQLFTVGALGVTPAASTPVGFDITTRSLNPISKEAGYVSLTPTGAAGSSFYSINLNTGALKLIGAVGQTATTLLDVAVVVRVESIFATDGPNLLTFNAGKSSTGVLTRPFTGLATGQTVVAIDFRPADGRLYGLTSTNTLVRINTSTGAVTQVGAGPIAGTTGNGPIGLDFNPVPDRIRVVAGANNFRLNPDNGAIANAAPTDQALTFAAGDPNAGATPNVTAAAYTANFAGSTATTLYVIDAGKGVLATQGTKAGDPNPVSPNLGMLFTVGSLNVPNIQRVQGFDIDKEFGVAYAAITTTGQTSGASFYSINLVSGAATLIGAIGGANNILDIAVANRVEMLFASTTGNRIVSFASTQPSKILSTLTVTGLGAGENIVGIDFRPATNALVVITSGSRVYTVNTVTGAATPVGPAFTPALTGTNFGVDFNPVPDRIRVVSDNGQNLRLNPDTGAVQMTDGTLAFMTGDPNAGQTPTVVAAAYNNKFKGAANTTLYVIDAKTNSLATQGSPGGLPTSPNDGKLFTVGSLGITSTNYSFAVADETQNAVITANVGGMQQLYSLDLQTGTTTPMGTIADGTVAVTGLTFANFGPASGQNDGATTTNAASFAMNTVAPSSIAAVFGKFQTMNGQPAIATTTPLPNMLGGVSATLNGTAVGLFFTSNAQLNVALPDTLTDGSGILNITNTDGSTVTSPVTITRAKAGIFTFAANGQGAPAAFVTPDGKTFTPVFDQNGNPVPVSVGTAANPNFLVLFLTGIRNAPGAPANDPTGVAKVVTVTIGSQTLQPSFAGAQGLVNLDQVNVMLPQALAGAGMVMVQVNIPGVPNSASQMVPVRFQ